MKNLTSFLHPTYYPAIVATAYYASAKLGLLYAVVGNTVTLVWPPSGVALAALLAWGLRPAFGVWAGAFLANLSTGLPTLPASAIAVGNTLAALAGYFMLTKFARFQNRLERRQDVLGIVLLAGGLSTMVSASIGAATLAQGKAVLMDQYASVWLKWWLGDMMGILVVAPALLIWTKGNHPNWSPGRLLEALILSTLLGLICYRVFIVPDMGGRGYYPAALAVFPFVIWTALRFELRGASAVTLLLSFTAIWGTTQGNGPFAVDSAVDGLIRWCTFVNIVAVTGLLLAASRAEQRKAQNDLKQSRDELEQRVRERTADLEHMNANLKREMQERRSLESELILLSEKQQKRIGQELHDGLGQQLTGIALFSAGLCSALEKQAPKEATKARRISELANQAVVMARQIVHGLYPSVLESNGLLAALEQLASDTQTNTGIVCEFHADPTEWDDDPLVAINLYRITQEAVNNALKYSGANRLRIDLEATTERTRLSVADNGSGFDPDSIRQTRGMGLHNLHYRASMLGGYASIGRADAGGTIVVVAYPSAGKRCHDPA